MDSEIGKVRKNKGKLKKLTNLKKLKKLKKSEPEILQISGVWPWQPWRLLESTGRKSPQTPVRPVLKESLPVLVLGSDSLRILHYAQSLNSGITEMYPFPKEINRFPLP